MRAFSVRAFSVRAFSVGASLALLGLLGVVPPARAESKTYTAKLSADEETPAKGPAGGSGAATIKIDMGAKQLCYAVSWSPEVGTPNAGHIHKGPKGLNGPVLVQFDLPAKPQACVTVDQTVLADIAGDPGGHYVNLHSDKYPGGAVRGQLQG